MKPINIPLKELLRLSFFIIFFLSFTMTVSAQIIFENGFEGGASDWGSSGSWKITDGLSNSFQSSNESREGNKSVLFQNSPGKKRT